MDSLNYGTETTQVLNSSGQKYCNPDKSDASAVGKVWSRAIIAIDRLRTMSLSTQSFICRKVSVAKRRVSTLFYRGMEVVISNDIKNKVKIFHKNFDECNHLNRDSKINKKTSNFIGYHLHKMQKEYSRALEKKTKENLNTDTSWIPKCISRAMSNRRVQEAKRSMELQGKAFEKSQKESSDAVARLNASMEICHKSQNDMVEAFNIAIEGFKEIGEHFSVQIAKNKNKIIELEEEIFSCETEVVTNNKLYHQLTSKLKDEQETEAHHTRILKHSEESIKYHTDYLEHADKHRNIITLRNICLCLNRILETLAE